MKCNRHLPLYHASDSICLEKWRSSAVEKRENTNTKQYVQDQLALELGMMPLDSIAIVPACPDLNQISVSRGGLVG